MANKSTIKSLDKLMIKAISSIRKSQKRANEAPIYVPLKYHLKTVTLIVYFGEKWSTLIRMKLLIIN